MSRVYIFAALMCLLLTNTVAANENPTGEAIWQYLEAQEYAEGAGVYHSSTGGAGLSEAVHPVIMSFAHTFIDGVKHKSLEISFPYATSRGVATADFSYVFTITGNELFFQGQKVGELVSDRWVDINWTLNFNTSTADGDSWRKLKIEFHRGRFAASLSADNGYAHRRGDFHFLFRQD